MSAHEIKHVLIVGAGTMGQQIGLQCAMHGCTVTLYDIEPEILAKAETQLKSFAAYLVAQNRLTETAAQNALSQISTTTDPARAAQADLLSESVPEIPELKAKVLAQFNQLCPPHTIFATNTSSLIPSMFAQASGRPAQLAALHFHQPVWDSNVADIMPHPGTAPETMARLEAFARQIGQIPIVLKKESHNYVFNAMLGALNTAALTLAAKNVASIEDIDRAWMGVMKTRIGPFGILDVVGLKTAWDINEYWAKTLQDLQLQTNADFLKTYLDEDRQGVKNGRGFYDYPNPAFQAPDFLTGK